MSTPSSGKTAAKISVRAMRAADLTEAARIMRIAFGTHIGAADPESFGADRDYIAKRFRSDGVEALIAEVDGVMAGSNIATRWGSFAFFGPLTIRPDFWNRGVASELLAATMDIFNGWGVNNAALFTFASSAKHAALYQKYGFWARFLTAVMSKDIGPTSGTPLPESVRLFSRMPAGPTLDACRELTDLVDEGLDVNCEIRAARDQHLGDTVLVYGNGALEAIAVCHCGEGTEAGRDACFIKFGAVRPSANPAAVFNHLLNACGTFAASRGLKRLEGGVNMACSEAYRQMLAAGFRTTLQGVAMHRNDAPAWNRPGCFVIADLR